MHPPGTGWFVRLFAAAIYAAALLQAAAPIVASASEPLVDFVAVADGVPLPLVSGSGDAQRGRAVVLDRTRGNCLICHAAPEPDERFMGELGPSLAGVGTRLTTAQLRLRMIDQTRLNPATVMPPYYRVDGLTRVGAQYRGKPVLTAGEIEDVVAYLATLKR